MRKTILTLVLLGSATAAAAQDAPSTPPARATTMIGRHDHEIHGGQKGGIKRQDARRFRFVPSVAQCVEGRACRAEIDDGKEGACERIEPEMRAKPGQPQGKNDLRG